MTPPPPTAEEHGRLPQQYCLKWNNHNSNISGVFDRLRISEQFVDATLATADGKTIKCHKILLSAGSGFLEELLAANPSDHPTIVLSRIRHADLRLIVDFMYSGEVAVEHARLPGLLEAARLLRIKGLWDSEQQQQQNQDDDDEDICDIQVHDDDDDDENEGEEEEEEQQPTETAKEESASCSVRDSLETLLRQQMMATPQPQPQQVSLPTTPLLVGSQKRKTKKASSGKGGSGLIKRARKSEEEVTSTQNISAFMKGMSPHSPPQLMASPPSSLSPPLTPSASAAAMTNNISQLFGLTNAYFLSNLEMAKTPKLDLKREADLPELPPKTTTPMPDIPSLLSQSVPLPPSSLSGVTHLHQVHAAAPAVAAATPMPCPPPAILAQIANGALAITATPMKQPTSPTDPSASPSHHLLSPAGPAGQLDLAGQLLSSAPVRRYKQYTEDHLQQALREIMEGQSINRSSNKFNIPARTLRDWMKRLNIKSVFTHHSQNQQPQQQQDQEQQEQQQQGKGEEAKAEAEDGEKSPGEKANSSNSSSNVAFPGMVHTPPSLSDIAADDDGGGAANDNIGKVEKVIEEEEEIDDDEEEHSLKIDE